MDLEYYNTEETHSGKHCYGKTPMQTWNEPYILQRKNYLDSQYQMLCLYLCRVENEGNLGIQKNPIFNSQTLL